MTPLDWFVPTVHQIYLSITVSRLLGLVGQALFFSGSLGSPQFDFGGVEGLMMIR
tara:strand:+ start:14 stop:178 length:165 start_codon:yes stop_codon:yes gene_type:complete